MRGNKSSEHDVTGFLKIAVPAVIMPLIFTVIPGLVTDNVELLRKSWSVIAPSSLIGALAIVYIPPLAQLTEQLLVRMPKITVAALAIGVVGFAALGMSQLAGLTGIIPAANGTEIAMSAAIGAFATTLAAFSTSKRSSG